MASAAVQRRWRASRGARTGVVGRRATAPCGTLAAQKRHVRRGEAPCDLCRLAARCDRGFRRHRSSWQRSDRFAWLLHRAVLDMLLADPETVMAAAAERLAAQRGRPGAAGEAALWQMWAQLLDGPVGDLAAAMLGLDEPSKQLRTTTPFVGIISESARSAALNASRAA